MCSSDLEWVKADLAKSAFQKNKTMRSILGDEFADSYVKLKMEEWNSYMQHFSEWERQNALDV